MFGLGLKEVRVKPEIQDSKVVSRTYYRITQDESCDEEISENEYWECIKQYTSKPMELEWMPVEGCPYSDFTRDITLKNIKLYLIVVKEEDKSYEPLSQENVQETAHKRGVFTPEQTEEK